MKRSSTPGPRADAVAALRAHAEEIIDGSAIPAADREDVAEELYGHLWQRWQDEMAAGLDEFEAVDAAIAAFGGPDELGRDMTLAYHSRLYASTIGVLLPAITPSSERPPGFRRTRVLLGLWAALLALGILVTIPTGTFTPLRGVVATAACVVSFAMTVLAYRALALQQRWARVYAQALAFGLIVQGVVSFLGAGRIELLALFALFLVPAVADQRFAAWVANSRPVMLGLRTVIVAAVAMPMLAPAIVGAMPDPTVASASDLSMHVRVSCATTDTGATEGTAIIDLRWTTTDLFPYGVMGFTRGIGETDSLGLGEDFTSGTGITWLGSDSNWAVTGDANMKIVDENTGEDVTAPMFVWSSNLYFDVGPMKAPIDPGHIVAGHTYRATMHFIANQIPEMKGAIPSLRVRYEHQHRWGLEAIVACGGTADGVPVTSSDFTTFP